MSDQNSPELNHPNQTLPFVDDRTLGRFIAGECTPNEQLRVEQWLTHNESDQHVVDSIRQDSLLASTSAPTPDTNAAINKLEARLGLTSTKITGQPVHKVRWNSWGTGIAALSACLLTAIWYTHTSLSTPEPETYKTYTTRAGQRAAVTLRDGSRVTLGPLTTLRILNNRSTSVEVAGEALFNVNHSAAQPFSVTSHGVTTRVLGTEFVVRAYDASLIHVAVRSGRVSVQPAALTPANAAIVAAGEAAVITPNNVPSITRIADLDTEFSWDSGDLVLSGVPLGDAMLRLSRWYGMEFHVTDPSLLKAKINGTFPTAFRERDMRNLAGAINAKVTQSGNAITFTPFNQ